MCAAQVETYLCYLEENKKLVFFQVIVGISGFVTGEIHNHNGKHLACNWKTMTHTLHGTGIFTYMNGLIFV